MDFVEGQREQSRLVFKRGSVVSAIGPCLSTTIIRARVRRSQENSVDFTKAGTYNFRYAKTKEKERGSGRFGP